MCPHMDKTFCKVCHIIMCMECGDSLEHRGGRRYSYITTIIQGRAKCRSCVIYEMEQEGEDNEKENSA